MTVRKISTGAVLLGIMLAFVPIAAAGGFASDAHNTFQRIEANAMDIRENAARLRTFTRFPTLHNWEVHADALARQRAAVNDLAELLGALKENKDELMPRQNKAFNYIIADAAKLSDDVEKAIQVVNEQREKIEVGHPDYDKTVDEMYAHADRIVAAVGLIESHAEIEAAQEKLMSQTK